MIKWSFRMKKRNRRMRISDGFASGTASFGGKQARMVAMNR